VVESSKISYGLYIVTSRLDGKLNGQIVSIVFQVTSERPRVAVTHCKDHLRGS
jgi:flavin reductase (DIM6/NTAB) family NADH-FMN oxidoreductase RutF